MYLIQIFGFQPDFAFFLLKKGKYRVQDDSFMIKNPLIS